MKRLIFGAMVCAAAITAPIAQAQSPATGTFTVAITLNSTCTLSAIPNVVFTYTSFQGGASAATNGAGFDVRCTDQLFYTLGLQSGTGAAVVPGSATIGPITDDAVNLAYSLGLSGGATPGGATGSGVIQNYSITGTMAAAQGGTCATASCTNAAATNRQHTLIVAW